jgi:hypothetical protein
MLAAAGTGVGAFRASTPSFFFATLFTGFFTHDARESIGTFATQSLAVADGGELVRRQKRVYSIFIGLVLLMTFLVSGASTLIAEYSCSMSRAEPPTFPINPYGTDNVPEWQILSPTARYASGQTTTAHSRGLHVSIGAGLLGALAAIRVVVPGWPIHPIGYLLVYTRPVSVLWFSMMVGWLLKALVVRFGGAGLYRKAMPVFIGLAFWMVFAVIAAGLNYPYRAVGIMP